MSPPEDALTLADLPSDIIRIIVQMEPKLITRMRLIAPSWYMPISIIKRIHWWIIDHGHLMTLNAAISSVRNFDLDWYDRSTILKSDTELEVNINSPLLFSRDQFIPPSITSLFSKCMAIGRLEIDIIRPRNDIEIDDIFAAISGFPLQELSISVCRLTRAYVIKRIITFLSRRTVKKRLVLTEDMFDFVNYSKRKGPLFLFKAVKFVPEVEIAITKNMSRTRINERQAIR